ncbi:MAG TPA: (4Fe-4S)-binding protein [Verrucomicrobia bacterium]|nr:MAG: hypothetical protein A2X46_14590 [Lentisphaerae bacterium GWF2_57_35]HBA83374.1 (4Fe-4S)-binding protein [Verrucomicrobiota bacterium]
MYSKLQLYYMSGTGNSFRAAEWMADTTQSQGLHLSVQAMDAIRPAQVQSEAGTLTGLFLPTHAFTAPWGMIRFVLQWPRVKTAEAFVLVTRGGLEFGRFHMPGMEGTAGYLMALLLRWKGYRIRGVMGLDMPSNWLTVHPSLSPQSVESMESRAQPKAEGYILDLLAGKSRWHGWICLLLGLLLAPASLGYLLYGRFFLAKMFFANEQCNRCGLCAQNCPFGAIRMRGSPYWTYSCESCMRCMAYCPKEAIEAGHSWAIVLYYLASIPVGVYMARWLGGGARVVQYGYYLLSILLAYGIFWRLIRIRWINRLFTWTTLTHVFRRYHEPSTPLGAWTRRPDS